MPTQRKRKKPGREPSKGARKAGSSRAGNQEELMKILAQGLGNQALEQRLRRATGRRDALLDFIAERLEKIRDVQLKESALLHQKDKWWRDAVWQEPGVWMPEPQRWGAAAKEYRQAVEALCRGDLGRGLQLLERAMETERATLEQVPHGLGLHPDEEAEQAAIQQGPEDGQEVGADEGCPERELPKEIGLADEIERFRHTARPLRGILIEQHDPKWWEEEEEEEEEEGED